MRHSTFSTGSPVLVASILLCWMHQPFDCLDETLERLILNKVSPAICDREYRLKYFQNRKHREAVRAGLLYVPFEEGDPDMQAFAGIESWKVPDWMNIEENYQSEFPPTDLGAGSSMYSGSGSSDFSPIDSGSGPSDFSPIDFDSVPSDFSPTYSNVGPSEFLPIDFGTESLEFLPTGPNHGPLDFSPMNLKTGPSEYTGYSSDEKSSHAMFALRRRLRPIARNASELYGLKLQSRRNRLWKFVDKTMRDLKLNNAVLPTTMEKLSGTNDFCKGKICYREARRRKLRNIFKVNDVFEDRKIRYPVSRRPKLRNIFKVNDVFEDRKIHYPVSRKRKLRNSFKVDKIFGYGGIRSPKRQRQFNAEAKFEDRFSATKETLVSPQNYRRGETNSSGNSNAKIFWSQDTCKPSRRIVGGRSVESVEELPYMAFVDTGCGGGIISNSWVLTAGHCVDRSVAPTYIHVGSIKLMTGCQYNIVAVYIHPRYSRKTLKCDIALLKISPSFVFSPAIKSIPLSTKPAVRKTCGVVAGWGAEEHNGALRIILSKTAIPIVSRSKCRHFRLSKHQFCAGYDDAYSDTCQGDSGGPIVVDGIVVGIVSYGYKCAAPKAPGVYVDVSYFRNWIRQITGI